MVVRHTSQRESIAFFTFHWYNTSMEDKIMDVDAVAGMLKCSARRVRELLGKGEIKGKKPGKNWIVLESDVLEYLRKGE